MRGFQGGGSHDQPGGQTREHAQLARSLGVEQLAVVITKLDTVDYSQVRATLPAWPAFVWNCLSPQLQDPDDSF